MAAETSHEQSFQIERHGEVAVVIPTQKVEEMHEALILQAAKMVVGSLMAEPPTGIVIDLSQVKFFGSCFISFMLRCHMLAKKQGSEIVVAGASDRARELLHTMDLDTLWAIYATRQEAIDALGGAD
jgi:anti-sigma B factor antagonist